ncbi:MAG: YbdK family carboxylate-amine ligase [Planctomycetales bacterium]|nr:YbdK family carboxylate-amine ligase [Planctomycetales bacterium]
MATIEFTKNERPTLGIEIELGLVDSKTLALSSSFPELAEHLRDHPELQIKPELMQCVVEIITDVCDTVDDAEVDLRNKLIAVEQATDQLGLRLWWGATHPFSLWKEQKISPDDRYHQLVELLQELARRLVTFGLHVHVGVDSGDKAVMICDRILRHLPTLLAITSSSPFWEGRQTGLQSHRSKVMEGLPTAGMPTLMRNWSEYVWLVNHMVQTGFINTIREIWWDVRPHNNFGTVEVRVCDMPGNLDDTLAVAALIQCLVKALSDEIDGGTYQHDCHPMMVQQNKWRATRFGTGAHLVDSYTYQVMTVAQAVDQLADKLTPVAAELGCEHHLERCRHIAASPSWADRQLSIMADTGSAEEVVRQLSEVSRISPLV